MVAGADAIVIGTVTEFLREAHEGAYAPDGTLQSPRQMEMTDQGGELRAHPGVPSSYFAVAIERVLLNDGRLEDGGSFALRLYGLASDPASQAWPLPQTGQRLLLALGRNPDHQSYSTGPWGLIEIDGPEPVYFNWDHTPVAYAEGMSPAAFLSAIEALTGSTD